MLVRVLVRVLVLVLVRDDTIVAFSEVRESMSGFLFVGHYRLFKSLKLRRTTHVVGIECFLLLSNDLSLC